MPRTWRALLLPGLFFALDLGTWHWSFEFTSVANATLEANLAIVFVAFASWLWLKERFTWLFPVGAGLALVGMAVLVGPSFQRPEANAGATDAWIGDLMGLSVALFYTGYQLSIKNLVGRFPVLTVMTASTATCALFLLVGVLISPGRLVPVTWQAWALVAALALIAQVFGQGLIAYGMRRLPVGLASVVLVAQPVMAALLGWALLGQALAARQIGAGLLVLAGIYLARRGHLAGR
jgi:drug/metabolite transporter (DMT)-like permease